MVSKKVLLAGLFVLGVIVFSALSQEEHSSENRSSAPVSTPAVQSGHEKSKGAEIQQPSYQRLSNPASKISPSGLSSTGLAIQLADLKGAADNGNALAACHVGHGLTRCISYANAVEAEATARDQLAKIPASSSSAAVIQRHLDNLANIASRDKQYCDGINAEDRKLGWRYLLQSAKSGNSSSTVLFASGFGMSPLREPGEETEAWREFRLNAIPLLEMAVSQGEPSAVALLAQHMIMPVMDIQLLPVNPQKSLSYLFALSNVADGELKSQLAVQIEGLRRQFSLSEAIVAQAKLAGDQLSNTIFKNKTEKIPFARTVPQPDQSACK